MLVGLERGVISGTLAYNIDRIARQPRELERLIDVHELARRPMVFATTAGDYDLTGADGRFQARIQARIHVTMAHTFSSDAARRVARQKLAEARDGKPYRGQRAFGWKDADARTPDPAGQDDRVQQRRSRSAESSSLWLPVLHSAGNSRAVRPCGPR
ncbi:hypothetical protein [Streptomyces lydicus]|uniref:hypothetical protein n=1 Tax=Streptomyces lydicus TaxID=47763 RepID=UPI0037B93691